MKNYFFILAIIILFINCQKREVVIVQENAENYSPTTVEVFADVDDIISQPVQAEATKTIQEIIENYTFPSSLQSVDQGLFAFQIEGNFTDSGNMEIIAFYKYKNRDSINAAFCFVCDSSWRKN